MSEEKGRPLWRDLLIPGAIVLAGVVVGGSLYLSGNSVKDVGDDKESESLSMLDMAVSAGANEDDFASCFEKGDTLAKVQADMDNAVATGGQGTPWAILIGPNGNKYVINGALPQAQIEQLIEKAKADATAGIVTPADQALDLLNPISDSDHVKGDRNAAIKIVEYTDYECPFCTRMHTTMNNVLAKHGDVAWVIRHFPLESLHPQAKALAVAAECVARSGGNDAFWKFTDDYMKE